MIKNPLSILLAVSVMACGSDGRAPTDVAPDAAVDTSVAPTDASVATSDASDTSAPAVNTRIASVYLASDCPEDAAREAILDEQCLEKQCPSWCDQSSVQITFVSEVSPDQAPRSVTVLAVRLLDAKSGKVLDALASRAPAIWTMNDYSPWDQRLTSDTVQAYYKLSAPDWDGIGAEWDASFILEVDLEIEGAKSTVRSDAVQRAPQVVT